MLYESRIESEILAMHCRSSGITRFLPSNVLLTTIISFFKHLRMIRSCSFGPNRENGTVFCCNFASFYDTSLIGHYKAWDQSFKTNYHNVSSV